MNIIPEIEVLTPRCVLMIEADGKRFYASFEDNTSAKAFIEKLRTAALALEMCDCGKSKTAPLPWKLPQSAVLKKPSTGDIVFDNDGNVALFYCDSDESFTRIARIGNVTRDGLLSAFGKGCAVTFSLEWDE